MYKKITLLVLFMTMPTFTVAMNNKQAPKQGIIKHGLPYIWFGTWDKEKEVMYMSEGNSAYSVKKDGKISLIIGILEESNNGLEKDIEEAKKQQPLFKAVLNEYKKPLENIMKATKRFGTRLNFSNNEGTSTLAGLENMQDRQAEIRFGKDVTLNPDLFDKLMQGLLLCTQEKNRTLRENAINKLKKEIEAEATK